MRNLRSMLTTGAAIAAAAVGGAAIANAATSNSSTTSSSTTSASVPSRANFPAHGTAKHEDAEKPVTGTAAAKAKAAAVKAAGGGTAGAVTSDYSGDGYEVTVTKSDGSQVEYHLDSSFNVRLGGPERAWWRTRRAERLRRLTKPRTRAGHQPGRLSSHSSRRIAPSRIRASPRAAIGAGDDAPRECAGQQFGEVAPGDREAVGRRIEDVLEHRDQHLGQQPAEARRQHARRRPAPARSRSRRTSGSRAAARRARPWWRTRGGVRCAPAR